MAEVSQCNIDPRILKLGEIFEDAMEEWALANMQVGEVLDIIIVPQDVFTAMHRIQYQLLPNDSGGGGKRVRFEIGKALAAGEQVI